MASVLQQTQALGRVLIARARARGSAYRACDAPEVSMASYSSQLSLLVNAEAALWLRRHGLKAPFIQQAAAELPLGRAATLRHRLQALGLTWDGEPASLGPLVGALPQADLRTRAIVQMVAAQMGHAHFDSVPGCHALLHLPAYLHLTAPARRLEDLLTQRILLAHVEGRPVPYQGEAELHPALYSIEAARARQKRADALLPARPLPPS
ncbi:MAG: RNB domain-containing ribonuclease [Deltaproteobacteria bacterium]|nr:MAG: RNB domain-containing ribonuclease [Deltaproteobacteria bacterium]